MRTVDCGFRWGAGLYRRGARALLWIAASIASVNAAPPQYPGVRPDGELTFPRDFGAHPEFRTEWWYVTGQIETADRRTLGFQVTFFRSRPALDESNPSGFAPKQILFAHAALSDAEVGRLLHDQRAARAGFGLAQAGSTDTAVQIGDWSLRRDGGAYRAELRARDFELHLSFNPTQPVLLNGGRGISRKGPQPAQASWYYSVPHLAVSGTIVRAGRSEAVTGSAWLDHEWSTAYLAEGAVGWDWTGINLDDGGALMLFRIRTADGGSLWAGGTLRRADGAVTKFGPEAVEFLPLRRWRSTRTQTEYPVAMRVSAGGQTWELAPLMDDQELDSRATTGAIYWEGAVQVTREGKRVGAGYLELTGYGGRLQM